VGRVVVLAFVGACFPIERIEIPDDAKDAAAVVIVAWREGLPIGASTGAAIAVSSEANDALSLFAYDEDPELDPGPIPLTACEPGDVAPGVGDPRRRFPIPDRAWIRTGGAWALDTDVRAPRCLVPAKCSPSDCAGGRCLDASGAAIAPGCYLDDRDVALRRCRRCEVREPALPAEPDPAALPIADCSPGWSQSMLERGVTACIPPPRAACRDGEIQVVGATACAVITLPCDTAGYPAVMADAYVGSEQGPGPTYATIEDAALLPGSIVALQGKAHVAPVLDDIAIVGCAGTELEGTIRIAGAVTLESVRLTGTGSVTVAGALDLTGVQIDVPIGVRGSLSARLSSFGSAIIADGGAITLDRVVIDGGSLAAAGGATVGLADVWIGGAAGPGIGAIGSAVTAERIAIEGAFGRGIELLGGSAVTVSDAVIARARPDELGRAFAVLAIGSSVSLRRTLVEDHVRRGLFLEMGSSLSLTDVVIRGFEPDARTVIAVDAVDSPIDLERVAIMGANIGVLNDATSARIHSSAVDLSLFDLEAQSSFLDGGDGIEIAGPVTFDADRVRIRNIGRRGLQIVGTNVGHPDVRLADAIIDDFPRVPAGLNRDAVLQSGVRAETNDGVAPRVIATLERVQIAGADFAGLHTEGVAGVVGRDLVIERSAGGTGLRLASAGLLTSTPRDEPASVEIDRVLTRDVHIGVSVWLDSSAAIRDLTVDGGTQTGVWTNLGRTFRMERFRISDVPVGVELTETLLDHQVAHGRITGATTALVRKADPGEDPARLLETLLLEANATSFSVSPKP
jgi:hypothetical protein